jgi:thiamine monophosphate synthase
LRFRALELEWRVSHLKNQRRMKLSSNHKNKSKQFIQRLKDAKANGVTLIVIREPEELGDTYEQVIASLNHLAAMDLNLAVLPKDARL